MLRRFDPFDRMFDIFGDLDGLFSRTLDELRDLAARMPGARLLPAGSTATDGVLSPAPRDAMSSGWTTGFFKPAVESCARDGNLVVRVELPGVDPGEIEVSVAGDRLTVRGQKLEQRESDEGSLHFREIAHGRFERSFTLPEGARTDQVKATCSNGVLEITIPDEGIPAARKVPIEVSGGTSGKTIKAA